MSHPVLSAVPHSGRRPFVTIDGWALKSNWRHMANTAPGARTGAAVKAGGYGLGAPYVAKALFAAGCRDFFVAWAEEGAELRAALPGANTRIFVLQGLDGDAAAICREHRLVPVLSNLDDARIWQETGIGRLPAPAALQFETGMNRLGMDEADARKAAALARAGAFDVTLVMSHLASADHPASAQSEAQRHVFERIAALFPHVARSLANSAGVFRGRPYHFDLTRPGIALYGGETALDPSAALRPVATLYAQILQVRTAPRGEAAGYGATAKLERATRIATIGIGYADGYLRSSSGVTPLRPGEPAPEVSIGGRRAPVLGRVSMDLTLVDVTDLPEDLVVPGEVAEMFGAQIAIDETARRAGTIAYEFLTGLGPRVARLAV
ncbi:alanine racemase [Aureimonas pseudogalii]|uniref:Alanine racemase n=1 Tax=Aureimonas pseudogalii TaxID=1744844 RepID=A0A7W6H4K2_9HYPH|nr:alanine racemase [Aureimonas pseudogalii]MBB3998552.1 alanine racemase [Aureimonas pseudogalii]